MPLLINLKNNFDNHQVSYGSALRWSWTTHSDRTKVLGMDGINFLQQLLPKMEFCFQNALEMYQSFIISQWDVVSDISSKNGT